MHVCNYQRRLQPFIISSFLTQKQLNYHLKGTTSEKSAELYGEGNERQLCIGNTANSIFVLDTAGFLIPILHVWIQNTIFSILNGNHRKERKSIITSLIMFVVLRPTGKIFTHAYGDVTFIGEGLQNLSYARHSWPMSNEGSLTCHTYCDTGQPFIIK